ncbi:MAG: DUF342 domain-containing protein [Deltaproteobacteria bacterium]|nr:DUF342 domain-containing protein [Candidatus Anaeroferrophillacea bacterium]
MNENNPETDKLDLFIHLEEHHGHDVALLSIRPNTRLHAPGAPETRQLVIEEINRQLAAHHIVAGIVVAAELEHHIDSYLAGYLRRGSYRDFYTFRIAQPTLPQPGSDSSMQELISLEAKPGRIVDERTGRIDFRDLGFSDKLVHEGDDLVILTHATPGIHGTDIRGRKISAAAGREPHRLKFDRRSVRAEKRDADRRTVLVATRSGFFYRDEVKGYFVDPDVLVQAVDFTTGNIRIRDYSNVDTVIKVEGTDNILYDSVKPGFALKAREITVKGNVGRGAVLEGDTITIVGIVDPDARIIGNHIRIDKVVGAHIEGIDIQINRVVTNATIVGRRVQVQTCTTSQLFGIEVMVHKELHAGTATAGTFLYCNRIQGNGTAHLHIDPPRIPALRAEQELLENERDRAVSLLERQAPQRRDKERLHTELEHEIELVFGLVEREKRLALNDRQRIAIRQLIINGHADDLGPRLDLTFSALTLKRLQTYHLLHRELLDIRRNHADQEAAIATIQQHIDDFERLYTRGLVAIGGPGNGEARIAFGARELAPRRLHEATLFGWSDERKQIVRYPLNLVLASRDPRLTTLSPQAQEILQRTAADPVS